MKKIQLTFLFILITLFSFAQVHDSGNKVGVGTNAPSEKLSIYSTGTSPYTNAMGIYSDTPHDHWLMLMRTNNKSNYSGFFSRDDNTNIWLRNKNGTITTKINSNTHSYFNGGNVGIGTAAPQGPLVINKIPATNFAHIFFGNPTSTSGQASAKITFAGSGIQHAGFAWIPNTNNNKGDGKLQLAFGGYQDPTKNATKVTFQSNGNVGVGTTNPLTKLESAGALTINPANSNKNYLMFRNNGTRIGIIGSDASIGGGNENNFGMYAYGNNDLEFWTNTDKRLVVKGSGNVGIGTTTPDAKLAVNGDIHAQEVRVDLQNWPDYVFDEEYERPTLEELEVYIQSNHHLPGVPSADEVEENGISLGEMNKTLVEKVEELTLYMLELKKENDSLKARIEKLEK